MIQRTWDRFRHWLAGTLVPPTRDPLTKQAYTKTQLYEIFESYTGQEMTMVLLDFLIEQLGRDQALDISQVQQENRRGVLSALMDEMKLTSFLYLNLCACRAALDRLR